MSQPRPGRPWQIIFFSIVRCNGVVAYCCHNRSNCEHNLYKMTVPKQLFWFLNHKRSSLFQLVNWWKRLACLNPEGRFSSILDLAMCLKNWLSPLHEGSAQSVLTSENCACACVAFCTRQQYYQTPPIYPCPSHSRSLLSLSFKLLNHDGFFSWTIFQVLWVSTW